MAQPDPKTKVLATYESRVRKGAYVFCVRTIEKFWAGHDTGKAEDAPGKFLEETVRLVGFGGEGTLERLAAEMKVLLHEQKEEITREPEGYSKLRHDKLLRDIRNDARPYLSRVRASLKQSL